MQSRELRASLEKAVMLGVNKAIERAVDMQTEGRAQAVSQFDLVYKEHAAGIELPDAITDFDAFGQLLGNAFGSIALIWLADAAGRHPMTFQVGYSWGREENKIPEVVWRIWPEFDVQHTQVLAPDGYKGETFKDFIGGTDRPFMCGPWVAKLYMRFHVITNIALKAGAAA